MQGRKVIMDFALLDRPNPNGAHFYPTRREPVLAIVVHATAGSEDLDALDDQSAEAVTAYAASTEREVSWHSGNDSDSWVDLLPAGYTAWHATAYNSCTYGHEISKLTMDWRAMPSVWVLRTLEIAALGTPANPGGLRRVALDLGIPLRWATRAELDHARATGGPPVGFISHHEIQPADRLDPGYVREGGRVFDTFPRDLFMSLMSGQDVVHTITEADEMFIRNLETGETAILSGAVLTGVDSANADRTNAEGGGGRLLGVDGVVWGDMVAKSRVIEGLADQITAVIGSLDALAEKLGNTAR
jgi:hypothetical protein